CSDGLWSVLPDHLLAQSFVNSPVVRTVPELLSAAVALGGKSGDNVTALAMMWEGAGELEDSATTIATHTLPIGSITTTIEAPRHADLDQMDVFNESEIEKAIAEIRGAIEKTAKMTSRN